MSIAIWNTLHDGGIVGCDGALGGCVKVRIEILYLMERLPGNPIWLSLALDDCEVFEWRAWDAADAVPLDDLRQTDITILSSDQSGLETVVTCVGGQLRTRYASSVLSDSNGVEIPEEELIRVADEYWDEWERKNRDRRNT